MASIIKLKRSSTGGAVPGTGVLQQGELAVNLADKKLFTSTNGTDVVTLSGDLYNLVSRANTSHSTNGADIILTVDNTTLSNDAISLVGDDIITITRNGNGSISFAADNDIIQTLGSDSGTATGSSHNINIVGTANEIETSATGSTVTIGLPDNVTVTGTLDAGGLASLDGGIDVDGAFTVADTTGNISTTGTLHVDGESTLASAIIEDLTDNRVVIAGTGGAVEDDANFTFDGTTLTIGSASITQASGNINTSGTLDVGGLASLDGGIDVDGAFTVADTTGNISTSGTLTVTGQTTLNGGITADGGAFSVADTSGNITTSGTINVTGVATFSNDASVGGQLNVTENAVISGNTSIGGNLSVDGDLNVEGTLTYLATTTVQTDDSLLKFAANNAADTVDTGFYALYVDGVTSKYAGIFRDASDEVFKVFKELEAEPTGTVNTGGTGYTLAQLDAVIDGGTY